jgi:hypothetical protein
MPRRHRAARDRGLPEGPPERPSNVAPEWASAEGATVRAVSGEKGKAYRCPGCQQMIHSGTPHLVVVADSDIEGRRHWHTACWGRELRRRGHEV